MQVNLKQNEIVAALKGYISQQGISLAGKTVEVAFTAGRKDTGISVLMTIEDSDIPGFDTTEEGVAKPVLSIVTSDLGNENGSTKAEIPQMEQEEASSAKQLEVEAVKAATPTLFG